MTRLILLRESLSNNKLHYAFWRTAYDDKKRWQFLLAQALATETYNRATAHRCVILTAYRGRTLDDDNLIGGLKHLRDALIPAGLILNDNKAGATFTYVQHLASAKDNPAGKGVRCTVIDIGD